MPSVLAHFVQRKDDSWEETGDQTLVTGCRKIFDVKVRIAEEKDWFIPEINVISKDLKEPLASDQIAPANIYCYYKPSIRDDKFWKKTLRQHAVAEDSNGFEKACSILTKEGHWNIPKLMNEVLLDSLELGIVSEESLRLLFSQNADINNCDARGRTSCIIASKLGIVPIVKMLIERNADVNSFDKKGNSSLREASFAGHIEVCQLLLDHKADVNYVDHLDISSLWLATWENHANIAKLLISRNANINLYDKNDSGCLQVAAWKGRSAILHILLQTKAEVNHADKEGSTPLWNAAWEGNTEICGMLITARAEIDCCDKNGTTPLQLAAWKGNLRITRLLVESLADVDKRANNGRDAYEIAERYGRTDITHYLRGHTKNKNRSNIKRSSYNSNLVPSINGQRGPYLKTDDSREIADDADTGHDDENLFVDHSHSTKHCPDLRDPLMCYEEESCCNNNFCQMLGLFKNNFAAASNAGNPNLKIASYRSSYREINENNTDAYPYPL